MRSTNHGLKLAYILRWRVKNYFNMRFYPSSFIKIEIITEEHTWKENHAKT